MKLWIKNILQNIINSIESEEDKTLPEDYFKNIVIKLEHYQNGRKSRNAFKKGKW